MQMVVVGVVGPIGSGKDTVAEYMAKKYKFSVISYRDIVKELTEKEGLEANRENMQKIARLHRDVYGENVFAEIVTKKAVKMKGNILLKEIRTLGDAEVPKKHFGKDMVIIAIDAPQDVRFERMNKRKRLGDPADLQQFIKHEETEKRFGYYDAIKLADYRIDNDGTIEDLREKVDSAVREILSSQGQKK